MILSAYLLLAPLLQAQPAQRSLPADVLNLAQIRRNVQASAMQVPDYACLETIERYGRTSPKRPFRHIDTLQLEVGMIGNKEVYSWPGAETFEAVSPGEIVSAGMVSTGEFMQLLRAVFVGGTSVITWRGEEELNGRRVLRYDYTLPLYGYRSRVNISGAAGDVSLRGSFWAGAETLELMRLESQANEIPPTLPLAAMVSRIDYGKMTVHGRSIWFPQSAELMLVEMSGQETRNRIEFSHCRQYAGSSTLSFDDPRTDGPSPAPRAIERLELPAGMTLELRLESGIESSTSGVGQTITARLASDAVYKKKVLIPAGALVKGRVRRLERSSELTPHFVVGLEFSTIENDNLRARFYGLLHSVQPVAGLSTALRTSSSKSTRYPSTSAMQGFRVEAGSSETLYFRELPGVGTFFMSGTQFRLPRGFRMTWQTVALPKSGR